VEQEPNYEIEKGVKNEMKGDGIKNGMEGNEEQSGKVNASRSKR
jgi:hypothetical protein